MTFRRRRRVFRSRVVALGLKFEAVAANVKRQQDEGWTLISTYMDVNRASVYKDQSVCGVFGRWEKP